MTDAAARLPQDDAREHLMAQVARMSWQQNLSHTEIATQTGMNRWQVARLLQEARDLGIVRIEIVPRAARRPDLETRLVAAFGLRDAVVVPSEGGPDAVAQSVAHAAGHYLAGLRPAVTDIGVSWGRTMAAVAARLPQGWASGVRVVQINGTVAPIPSTTGHDAVAETFAAKGGGRFVPLPVPAIVGARETREVLERDRIVADVLHLARAAPVYCLSFGALGPDSALLQSGNVTATEVAALQAAGAIGDILGRFIDASGAIVDAALDARTIGLDLADLARASRCVGVAAGAAKWRVTRAVLRARLITVLITDADTARYALEAPQ